MLMWSKMRTEGHAKHIIMLYNDLLDWLFRQTDGGAPLHAQRFNYRSREVGPIRLDVRDGRRAACSSLPVWCALRHSWRGVPLQRVVGVLQRGRIGAYRWCLPRRSKALPCYRAVSVRLQRWVRCTWACGPSGSRAYAAGGLPWCVPVCTLMASAWWVCAVAAQCHQVRATSPSGVVWGAPEPQYRMMLTSTVSHGFGRGEKYGKFADCGIATLIYVVLYPVTCKWVLTMHSFYINYCILPHAKYYIFWCLITMKQIAKTIAQKPRRVTGQHRQ